mmetsp:Transcript_49385/g.154874  ORF Transcript_49385/g.154874 Transcript_49385/m.154874 type:complete len:225 (-) Transcript_49385:1506-2180(-)
MQSIVAPQGYNVSPLFSSILSSLLFISSHASWASFSSFTPSPSNGNFLRMLSGLGNDQEKLLAKEVLEKIREKEETGATGRASSMSLEKSIWRGARTFLLTSIPLLLTCGSPSPPHPTFTSTLAIPDDISASYFALSSGRKALSRDRQAFPASMSMLRSRGHHVMISASSCLEITHASKNPSAITSAVRNELKTNAHSPNMQPLPRVPTSLPSTTILQDPDCPK